MRGTYTILSGSRSLPEVKQAMFEASHYYVQMDEMMEGVGKELARLNGCEAAMATTGCEAAIVLATIACVAGSNIEKCQALPYVKAKDQVIIPKYSRNPYDVGVRVVGAEVIEVGTTIGAGEDLARAAMICVVRSQEAKAFTDPHHHAIAKKEHSGVRGCGGGRADVTQCLHAAAPACRLFAASAARAAILRHHCGQGGLIGPGSGHHRITVRYALKCSRRSRRGCWRRYASR
jgi:hypothetical protein